MKLKEKIIPEKIEEEIKIKGFYLYKWLEINDLSNILKKNFLDILMKFGDKFSLLLLFLAIVSVPFLDKEILFYYIGYFFIGIFILVFVYLFFLGIYKGYYLIKNTFIVFTLDYIIINSKVFKISDTDLIKQEFKNLEKKFNKSLFENSTKLYDFRELKEILKKLYNNIYEKKIGSVVFLVLILYFISSVFIIFLYFVAIFFIFIFSIVIGIFIKIILLKIGNNILNINESFIKIDNFGNKLKQNSKQVKKLFKKASDNNWEKGLILNININIENINNSVSENIDLSIKLRNRIKKSKYNNLYNFNLYNSWLKRELYNPIFELKQMLLVHKKNITDYLIKLKKLQKDEKIINKKPYELQFIALNLQNKKLTDIILQLENYLQKLI